MYFEVIIDKINHYLYFQDKILEELDKDDSTHDSISAESDSEEDGIHIDKEKALAEKEKVITSVYYLQIIYEKTTKYRSSYNFFLKIAH